MWQIFDKQIPKILIFDQLDSSSLEARRMIENSTAQHGQIIWAKNQTAGYGRRKRPWSSEDGNLFFSVVLKPTFPLGDCWMLNFALAVAIGETLKNYINKKDIVTYKWPNDILLNGKKISGCLIELISSANPNDFYVICGVGVNVAVTPNEVKDFATSLKDVVATADLNLDILLFEILQELEIYSNLIFKQKKKLLTTWRKNAMKLGDKITVHFDGALKDGLYKGIDDSGSLKLSCAGKIQTLSVADVFINDAEIESKLGSLDSRNPTNIGDKIK